jgi:WD40 repeat protein
MHSSSLVYDLAVSPDGTLIAAAADNAHVPVFRRSDGMLVQDLKLTAATNPGGQTPVAAFRSVSFSADGSQVAAAEQRLHVWRVSDGTALVQPDALATGMIWEQSVAHAGPYAAFARVGGPAQIWDYTAGSSRNVLPRVNGNQGTVAFDPADELLVDSEELRAGADASTLEEGALWKVGASAPFRTITYATQEQPDRDGDLVFSPDGTLLAGPGSGAQPGLLRLWNPADGTIVRSVPAFMAEIEPIVWSPDGKLIAAAGADHIDMTQPLMPPTDESIRIFDAATLQLVTTLVGPTDFVTGLAFLPDGQHLVSGERTGLVRVWAVNAGSSRDLSSSAGASNAIAVSPMGDFVAVRGVLWDAHGHNGSISVQRTADGVEVGHFYLYGDGNMGAMTWSPDGKSLLAGSASALHVFCLDQMAPPRPATDGGTSAGDAGEQ